MEELLQLHNDTLLILEVEREVNFEFAHDYISNVLLIVTAFLVLPVNSIIIFWIKVIKNKTLIDSMILYSCVANIGIFACFFTVYPKVIWADDHICAAVYIFRSFFFTTNRVIPVTIVAYRYILVCHDSEAVRIGQSKLGNTLILITIFVPISLAIISALFCINDMRAFLGCRGRLETFYYDTNDFFGHVPAAIAIKTPIYHPIRLLTITIDTAYIFVVPVGYYKIYSFVRDNDLQVPGITNLEKRRRRKRNQVTIGFNVSIWVLEVMVAVIFLIPSSQGSSFLPITRLFHRYIIITLITSGISPILYIVGMSEVWTKMEIYLCSIIGQCRKKNTVNPADDEQWRDL